MQQRVIVVSGGGTGIGRAIARTQAAGGDRVVILGRRADVIEATSAELNASVGDDRVRAIAADVGDVHAVEALVDTLQRDCGTVDAVVNNAGGSTAPGEGLAGVAAGWRATLEQNVMTAVLLTTGVGPLLRRPGGRIILVGSMASRSGGGGGHYVAAKAALNGWVLALSHEFAPQGVTANIVLPGYTPDTELFGEGLPADIHDRIVSRISVRRAGASQDTADLVHYLVSTKASFVTGQVIECSGGNLPPNM